MKSIESYLEGLDTAEIERLRALAKARGLVSGAPRRSPQPVFPLQSGRGDEAPLFCVPGAGASITSFRALATALGDRRPVHGIQPRGIDLVEPPHTSVEDAAAYNLSAVDSLGVRGPWHLLGHSFGGAVAFEMACRAPGQGCQIGSLTVIDSKAPLDAFDAVPAVTEPQIIRELVAAVRAGFEPPLAIDEALIASAGSEAAVRHLHDALVQAGHAGPCSSPDMLRGSLRTFAAARRIAYRPAMAYPGTLRIVLVRNPLLDTTQNEERWHGMVSGWRRWVSDVEAWHGPGDHFSVLRAPHANALAQWWRRAIEGP